MINMMLSEAAGHMGQTITGEDVPFRGCSIDSRTIKRGELFIAIRGENFDGHKFVEAAGNNGASAAVIEYPDKSPALPFINVDDCRYAMGELASAWRRKFSVPLIAITGSNGKTTVKEMVSSILSQKAPILSTRGNLNNEIGVPLTLFGLADEHLFAVIEMGANHPGEISRLTHIASPTVAAITQCAPSHLEGFGSIDGVANAKAEIYEGLSNAGIAIINADDKYAPLWKSKNQKRTQISFSIKSNADVTAQNIKFDQDKGATNFDLMTSSESIRVQLPLPGIHNVMNSLAAAACCLAVNTPLYQIKTGLESMYSIKGRLQKKKGLKNSIIIDDTYNANPSSLKAALDVVREYPGQHWLVLGDMGELGDASEELHTNAGLVARESGISRLFAIGNLSKSAVAAFGDGARSFNSPHDLTGILVDELQEDITVLIKGSRAMAMENIVSVIVDEDQ